MNARSVRACPGEFYLKLGKFSEAETVARALLDENPDNEDYYRQLAASLQIGAGAGPCRKPFLEGWEELTRRCWRGAPSPSQATRPSCSSCTPTWRPCTQRRTCPAACRSTLWTVCPAPAFPGRPARTHAHTPISTDRTGDDFRQRVDVYLRSWLSKGAPSLFTNLRNLYRTPSKVQAIEVLLEDYLTNLRAKPSRFSSAGTASSDVWVTG